MPREGYYFRNASFYWYASFMAATCLVLYVAEEFTNMRIFWRISRFLSVFSAYWLYSGYIYGVSLCGFGISNIFYVKVNLCPDVTSWLSLFVKRDRFAQCKLCRILEIPQCPLRSDSGVVQTCRQMWFFHSCSSRTRW